MTTIRMNGPVPPLSKDDIAKLKAKKAHRDAIQDIVSSLAMVYGPDMFGNMSLSTVEISISSDNYWDEDYHFDFNERADKDSVWDDMDRLLRSDEVTKALDNGINIKLAVMTQYLDTNKNMKLEISKETLPTVLMIIGLYL